MLERKLTPKVFVFACAVAGMPPAAIAVDLSWQPQFRSTTRASDNIRWSATLPRSALGLDNSGTMIMKAESQDWRSTVVPTLNIRRYAIGNNLDTEEYGIRTENEWQPTQRIKASLGVDYTKNSTLTTELTDAGRQNVVADRDTISIQPNIQYQLDDRSSLNAGYAYSDIGFSAGQASGLLDYTFQQVSLGGTRFVTERLRVFTNGYVSEFAVDLIGSRSISYGGTVGFGYQLTPTFDFDLAAGYVNSDIDYLNSFLTLVLTPFPHIEQVSQPASASTGGPIASASFRKSFESMRTELQYARRVGPSVRGSQTLEDDIVFTADRDLTREFRVGFSGDYNLRTAEAENIATGVVDLDRDQAVLSAYVTYQFTRQFYIKSEYRFVRQSLNATGKTVNVNALFVTLNFSGDVHTYRGF